MSQARNEARWSLTTQMIHGCAPVVIGLPGAPQSVAVWKQGFRINTAGKHILAA